MSDMRLAYRPAEVAAAIGVGRSKAYELIARGEIPSIRIGGSIRVPLDALKQWMDQRLAEGSQQTAG